MSERYASDPAYRAYVDRIAAERGPFAEADVEFVRQRVRAGRREATERKRVAS